MSVSKDLKKLERARARDTPQCQWLESGAYSSSGRCRYDFAYSQRLLHSAAVLRNQRLLEYSVRGT